MSQYAEINTDGIVVAIHDTDGAQRVKIHDGDGCAIGRVFNGWVFEARRWSTLEFFLRMTTAERDAIHASNDPVIRDYRLLLASAREVVADDHRLIGGMTYAVFRGIFTPERAAEILDPAR